MTSACGRKQFAQEVVMFDRFRKDRTRQHAQGHSPPASVARPNPEKIDESEDKIL